MNEKAFQKVKKTFSNPTKLGYFTGSGVEAIIFQFDGNRPLPISFARKGVTETVHRYCQTEKEALALLWAVERLQIYWTNLPILNTQNSIT